MPSIFPRGGRLYAKIQDIDGQWRQVSTGFHVEQRADAEKWVGEQDAKVRRAREAKGGRPGALTLRTYALAWLDKRTNKTASDDRNRLVKHVLPLVGDVLVADFRPRHARDLILKLKEDAAIAPRTIRHISGLMHSVFKSAVIEDLIAENPIVYERGVLPKKVDKDPLWRNKAIFTRREVEQLISDPRIPFDRRVLYALKFFTGRHGEVSRLTWNEYDASIKPLGALRFGETKNGVPRDVPVHPVLAKMLAAWRPVCTSNIIAPTRAGLMRKSPETQKQFVKDLAKIGLRTKATLKLNRRGHDLRRTLITLARGDGASDSLLRFITHGPKQGEILDMYSSPPWEALCDTMKKLRIRPIGAWCSLVQSRTMAGNRPLRAFHERPQRDSKADSRASDGPGVPSLRVVGAEREDGSAMSLHQTAPNAVKTSCDVGLALLVARLLESP